MNEGAVSDNTVRFKKRNLPFVAMKRLSDRFSASLIHHGNSRIKALNFVEITSESADVDRGLHRGFTFIFLLMMTAVRGCLAIAIDRPLNRVGRPHSRA